LRQCEQLINELQTELPSTGRRHSSRRDNITSSSAAFSQNSMLMKSSGSFNSLRVSSQDMIIYSDLWIAMVLPMEGIKQVEKMRDIMKLVRINRIHLRR
jgi:hypothetical protein